MLPSPLIEPDRRDKRDAETRLGLSLAHTELLIEQLER
jgi:hypothetical protein